MSVLQLRVEQEGSREPAWVLGFMEGLGRRKLTGYQAGAVMHLLIGREVPPGMFRQDGRNGGSLMIEKPVGKVSEERREVGQDGLDTAEFRGEQRH